MQVSSVKPYYYNFNFGSNNNITSCSAIKNQPQFNNLAATYPSSYYLSFQGRVDKGLKAFIERNQENCPKTFQTYTEQLSDEEKQKITPLQAMYNAYEYLDICETPDDIKAIYPDEPLFVNLKSSDKTQAKRGILYDIRLMKADIEETGETVLSTKEDLTVYLVKKIFLEGKTINKVNEDLDKDLNPVFKKDDKNYVTAATLKALGIKLPEIEFINSLKYTKDGYSDIVGGKISARWQSLTEEEKEAYKKSLINGRNEGEKRLSEDEKTEIKQKRSAIQKQRWAEMSPEEKTNQITSLLSGSKKYRTVMINAWNKLPDIRETLSRKLTGMHISNPVEKMYKPSYKSSVMSKTMTEFWAENPGYADKMGEAIALSMDEVEEAEKNGELEKFVTAVLDKQTEIVNEEKDKKEKELMQCAAATIAALKENSPYMPFSAMADFGMYASKFLYSGTEIDINSFTESRPALGRQIFYAQMKEFYDCAKNDETKKALAERIDDDFIDQIGLKIKNEGLKFDIELQGKKYSLEFEKEPDKDNIDKNYTEYQKELTLEERKKLYNIMGLGSKLGTQLHGYPNNARLISPAVLDKVLAEFGGVARETIGPESELSEMVIANLFALCTQACYANFEAKYKANGKMDEFSKLADAAKQRTANRLAKPETGI